MKNNWVKMIKMAKQMTMKHSAEILTGLGIAGLTSAAIMAVTATPKALAILAKETCEEGEYIPFTEITKKVSKKDIVKLTWKCYLPSATIGIVSISCLIGASAVNYKRNAALATAYNLSATAFANYRDKVVETIGEEKAQLVQDAVVKERIEAQPPVNREVIISSGDEQLCLDLISGRYFRSDMNSIKAAENEMNRKLMNEMYISLNEFFYELGLKPTKQGNELGWNIDDGKIELHFSTQFTDDGRSCIAIDYAVGPRYDYSHLM